MSARLLNLGCGTRRHPAWMNADLDPRSPEVLNVDVRRPLPFLDGDFDAVYLSHVLEHLAPDLGRRLLVEMARVVRPGGIVRVVVPDLEGICRAYLATLDEAGRGEPGAREKHAWMTLELVDQMARVRKGGLMLRWWQRDPVPAEPFVIARMGNDAGETIEHFRRKRAASGAPPISGDWRDAPEPDDAEALAFRRSGEVHRWMYDRISLAAALEEAGLSATVVCGPLDSAIPGWGEFFLEADREGRPHKPDSLAMEARRPG
jgi:predicted SAM-dependent methyltransferase